MKFVSIALTLSFVLMVASPAVSQVPFHRGVNVTNWFQARSAAHIKFNKFSRKDFENIKSLGCDVIRLPINLHFMTSGAPDYIPDQAFLHDLDQVVSWAEELQLYLILDNHSFDPAVSTDAGVVEVLKKVWSHMAQHYRNRSNYLLYEVLNEPHGISDKIWAPLQEEAVNAIRNFDKKHTIVVGGSNWNSYHNLDSISTIDDTNIIYTFHFYDPFVFTHQGASWVSPPMETLAHVPFPYNKDKMPKTPPNLVGKWPGQNLQQYQKTGTPESVKALIDIAVAFRDKRKVNIFCGEFGVFIPNSDNDDRVYWYKIVSDYFNEKNIPWTMWDYTNTFGLFNKGSKEVFESDLNVPLLQALQFKVPTSYK